MTRWKITYQSMSAFYELGYEYAETKEEAERQARNRATAFAPNEKGLIVAREER